MKKRRRNRIRNQPTRGLYREIWKVVDGAIRSTFHHHPEYLSGDNSSEALELKIRNSITKRVTGALTSYALRRTAPPKAGG